MGDLWKKFKKQFSRYKDSTDIPEGIPNVGNTCYINVIVQVLKWTPGFRSMLEKCKAGDTKTCVASNLSEIMKTTDKAALWSLLRDLGELIGRNNLASGTQEDCFELYNLLLENLQSDSKGKLRLQYKICIYMYI
ncbi:uncharacterized protein [Argopecten irradians]|uniref:uncharacterized protein n=1 Tax=Argopecten irradians TaxID=31199 RepID=UPI00371C7851